jgi:hypothetical protein
VFQQYTPAKGPIRPGQFVRLHYDNECIQRVEIRAVNIASTAETSEYAKSEEAKRKQFLRTDAGVYRMNLAVTLVGLIMSFCWNLDWRHYIRYWLGRGPQYSHFWIVGFRVFFLVTFISAAVQALKLITEPSRTAYDFEKAGLLSLYGVGFFFLADSFFRWRFRLKNESSAEVGATAAVKK